MTAASIRTKNPSAMWPGPIATKFGSVSHEDLKDGQGNKIAIFPTFEQGGAAQFALWNSAGYKGKTLQDAIDKWSGHNSSNAYARSIAEHIPGLSLNTFITTSFLRSQNGLKFMKLQAQWEAGQPYPMTDEQWVRAQSLALGEPLPAPDIPTPKPKPATQPASSGFFVDLIKSLFSAIFNRSKK